jgi:uncharacterized phage protein (TIGR01671 family)
MREIKFRAWDKSSKKMLYNVAVLNGKQVLPVQTSGNDYWDARFETSENILMQYTGLKDKNGTEIYEGDIVKDAYDNIQIVKISFISHKSYEDCFAGFGFGFDTHDLEDFTEKVEIIGNIYKNPELLDNK